MDNKLGDFLKKLNWTVECWSPFEISHIDGSFASGQAANYLVDSLQREENNEDGELTGKNILATDTNGKEINGKVLLVYTDALASGSIDYVQITYVSVEAEDGTVHQVRPRDIVQRIK